MEAVYKVWVQGDQLDTMLKQVIDWTIRHIECHINENWVSQNLPQICTASA